MLKQEFKLFCENWLRKAEGIDDTNISGAFDKFFTLFVVYNRLYVETTYRMVNNRQINLSNRNTFPDDKAAKDYVVQFLTCSYIESQIENDRSCLIALEFLKTILRKPLFNIKLNQISGMPQPDKDADLLRRLDSENVNTRITAVTDFIYSVRCNIFHAQKGYQEEQILVLEPVNVLLSKLITLLFAKLIQE